MIARIVTAKERAILLTIKTATSAGIVLVGLHGDDHMQRTEREREACAEDTSR